MEVKIFGHSLTSSIRTAIHSPEEPEVKVRVARIGEVELESEMEAYVEGVTEMKE